MIVFVQICGVDDAGRGSLLGPLVIAGISIKKSNIKKLSLLGVRDSKKLTPQIRESLYKKILEIVDDYFVTRISPRIVDSNVKKHNLNNLEAKYMAKVVSKLNPDISYVDSCDVNPKRFGLEISRLSNNKKIHSYHHADSRFIVVSAASIVAKVNRDRAILKIQRHYPVGSGYPSDSKTINFVNQYYLKNNVFPNFVRKSWKPAQQIIGRFTVA